MINAVAFSYQSLCDVRIELERDAPGKQNTCECGLICSPNALRTKKNPSKDHIQCYFFREANNEAPTSLVGTVSALKSAPRQVHGHNYPQTPTLSGSHRRLSARIETELDNREERPRFAERYSNAARSSCEYQCARPAVRAQRRGAYSPAREWKALAVTPSDIAAILR